MLDLSSNAVADVGPLAGLTGLERLDLSGNRIADVSALSGLTGLEVLLLDGNGVADVLPLWSLQGLVHLGLSDNRIDEVGLLAELRSLKRLDLGGNRVSDVSPLGDLSELVWLRLPGNPVSDAAPLWGGRLTGLRWLWLDVSPDAGGGRVRVVPVQRHTGGRVTGTRVGASSLQIDTRVVGMVVEAISSIGLMPGCSTGSAPTHTVTQNPVRGVHGQARGRGAGSMRTGRIAAAYCCRPSRAGRCPLVNARSTPPRARWMRRPAATRASVWFRRCPRFCNRCSITPSSSGVATRPI